MFEKAKIRRNMENLRKKIEKTEDRVAFYPLKTRYAPRFIHFLHRLEGYHKTALEMGGQDIINLKKELLYFLDEVKEEAGRTKEKWMQAEFAGLVIGVEALAELM